MSANIVNQVAFLRTSREFPEELHQLTVEVNKAYLDTSQAVNARTIGIYPTTRPTITGNCYYLTSNQKQQTFRQVFTFTATTSITHDIANITAGQFINCFGSYSDGASSFGLIFGTSVAIAGVITFYVTSTQIVFGVGAGAPALSSGRIVLEWIVSP